MNVHVVADGVQQGVRVNMPLRPTLTPNAAKAAMCIAFGLRTWGTVTDTDNEIRYRVTKSGARKVAY